MKVCDKAYAPAALNQGKETSITTDWESGWASELVWAWREFILNLLGTKLCILQLIFFLWWDRVTNSSRPTVILRLIDDTRMDVDHWWTDNWKDKVISSATSITNITWTNVGANPGFAVKNRRLTACRFSTVSNLKKGMYKVVQIWPEQTVTCLHTNSPGHIWTPCILLSVCTDRHWLPSTGKVLKWNAGSESLVQR
jgi:hypothetical protein